ncbi:MAG: CDP-alcohol phosphatidyltransferase family protein [Hyphomonadaceae bacterium]|nr:CDP-alcohol phosphatidyltransferase family protein [Hyphomonadaceae bacterium]
MLKQIPNALTLLRLILAPVIAWLFWMAVSPPLEAQTFSAGKEAQGGFALAAAILFLVAALTDLFDGMAARAFDAHSKFGRLIDPIADKALVGLPLLAAAIGIWRNDDPAWPIVAIATAVIIARDVTMTVLRMLSPDGEGVRVSSLAKWKTALELFVVGVLLVIIAVLANAKALGLGELVDVPPILPQVWLALLVLAAALSAYTAFQYLTAKKNQT